MNVCLGTFGRFICFPAVPLCSVLVPPRKNSEKVTAYGTYPGATVIRSVEDWLLGDTDGTVAVAS